MFPARIRSRPGPSTRGIRLCWNARFGDDQDWQTVEYPAAHDDPAFTDRLREVLLPAVVDYTSRAQERKLADYDQAAPGDVYEARDAIREVS